MKPSEGVAGKERQKGIPGAKKSLKGPPTAHSVKVAARGEART